jgi:zinc transport system substrate-binding protein
MRMSRVFPVLLLAAAGACNPGTRNDVGSGEKPGVFVSIAPQASFVERLAGDAVTVEVLVPPGRSPHNYEPTVKQMARLGSAKVWFRIGVPFERNFAAKIASTHPSVKMVNLSEGLSDRILEEPHHCEDDQCTEEHGEDDNGRLPTYWVH